MISVNCLCVFKGIADNFWCGQETSAQQAVGNSGHIPSGSGRAKLKSWCHLPSCPCLLWQEDSGVLAGYWEAVMKISSCYASHCRMFWQMQTHWLTAWTDKGQPSCDTTHREDRRSVSPYNFCLHLQKPHPTVNQSALSNIYPPWLSKHPVHQIYAQNCFLPKYHLSYLMLMNVLWSFKWFPWIQPFMFKVPYWALQYQKIKRLHRLWFILLTAMPTYPGKLSTIKEKIPTDRRKDGGYLITFSYIPQGSLF